MSEHPLGCDDSSKADGHMRQGGEIPLFPDRQLVVPGNWKAEGYEVQVRPPSAFALCDGETRCLADRRVIHVSEKAAKRPQDEQRANRLVADIEAIKTSSNGEATSVTATA